MAHLVFVVGASGVGKNSLMEGLADRDSKVKLATRFTTSHRDGETGDLFISVDEIETMRQEGRMFLSWQAHDITYVVPNDFDELASDFVWLINGARRALPDLMAKHPSSFVVHVTAPEEMRATRLAARRREEATAIAERLKPISWQPDLVPAYQFAEIRNDQDLETGIDQFACAIKRLTGRS